MVAEASEATLFVGQERTLRGGHRAWALGVMLLLLLPLPTWVFPAGDRGDLLGRECIFWAMTFALLGWVCLVEHRSLSSLGLRPPRWTSVGWGACAAAVMVAGMAFIYLMVFPAIGENESAAKLGSLQALPSVLRAAIVIRAAVFEELFYRGFMIERLSEISGRRSIAAIASLAAFTLGHLDGWGIGHLVIAGFGGSVLAGLYLWRRDLTANIIAHLLTDAIGLLA